MQKGFKRVEIPYFTLPVFLNSKNQLLYYGLLRVNGQQRALIERMLLGGADLDDLSQEMISMLSREPSAQSVVRLGEGLRSFIDGAGFLGRVELELPSRADIIIIDAGIGGVYVHALDLWRRLHGEYGLKALLLAPVEPPYSCEDDLAQWLITPRLWPAPEKEYSRQITFMSLARSIVQKVPSKLWFFSHRFPTTFFFDLIEKQPSIIHSDSYFDPVLRLGCHLDGDWPRRSRLETLQELYYGDPEKTNVMTSLAHASAVWKAFKAASENWFWAEPQLRALEKYFPDQRHGFKVVLPMIDSGRFSPGRSDLETRDILFTTTSDAQTILDKGILELTGALKRLPSSVTARMVVHKPEVLPDDLAELGDRVEVLTRVSKERMPDVYRSCRVNCRVSRRESSPVSILESMSCGIPVVVSPLLADNIPDIQDGVCGRVVETGDPEALAEALRGLLGDDAARAKMGQEARRQSLRHSFENNIQHLMKYVSKDEGREAVAVPAEAVPLQEEA